MQVDFKTNSTCNMSSRKYPESKNCEGVEVSKANEYLTFKGKYEGKLEFPEHLMGGEVQTQKILWSGGGWWIFFGTTQCDQ